MARPRSLAGLLAYLVALHVRRRPALLAIVLVPLVVGVLVSRARTTADATEAQTQATPPLQVAVLKDGFAIMEAVGDRHVVEVTRSGVRRRRSAIPTVTDTRTFGMPQGAGVGWIEGRKIHIAAIKGDGKLGRSQSFGSSAKLMCDGLASNDQRWAIGWLEGKDDRLWFVHGPTRSDKPDPAHDDLAEETMSIAMTTRPSYCAVRSANDYIALIYKVDYKLFVSMCTAKECGVQTRVPVDARDEILDLACQRSGCLAAYRGTDGALALVAFNLRGKATWRKKLAYASGAIQLAAAGDTAFVAALMTQEGPVVERLLTKNGSSARAWHGAPGLPVPAVTWSRDSLLLAYWDGNALAHDIQPMPR